MRARMIVLALISFVSFANAQNSIQDAHLKTGRGVLSNYATITRKDSLVLVCFWSVNSDESVALLNAINAHYDKWKESLPFHLMAVSIDEGKAANKVRGTANMNGWLFDIFTDINGEFRKALGSNNLPQAMILKDNKVIYQQSGYSQGTENYLFQRMQALK